MEHKLKHLEFIQSVIKRMTNNAFLLKGWVITIISLLIVISVNRNSYDYLIIAFLPIIVFWFLDSYYLNQERLFRDLYNKVRKQKEDEIDFSMSTEESYKLAKYFKTFFWSITSWFYFVLIFVIIALFLIQNYEKSIFQF